ncbi:MAG: glycine zipper 2TM domain-containing protein [Planctomycetes bacterium]|jgi:outer membrane lipoprotein SlyB|nr:glycine zipper 2TM domain-containing protein [Planctomycetota bacterium]MCP4839778.1 glycine zipper 2TM domain-containing protein [Planctomycetota bacterium]
MRILILSTLSVSVGFLAACDNSAQSGTLIGAGGGALAGQAIGHNTESTLIGAGVGALGGYIVGNEMDKKRNREQAAARSNSPVYQQNQRTDQLQAENERLRAEIENERLRGQLENERDY